MVPTKKISIEYTQKAMKRESKQVTMKKKINETQKKALREGQNLTRHIQNNEPNGNNKPFHIKITLNVKNSPLKDID